MKLTTKTNTQPSWSAKLKPFKTLKEYLRHTPHKKVCQEKDRAKNLSLLLANVPFGTLGNVEKLEEYGYPCYSANC